MKTKPSLIIHHGIRICALPLAALFAVPVSAANISWNGATDAVWSTGGNWVGGIAPVATDVAVFDATSVANLSTTLGADRTIQGLRITTPIGLITIGAGNLLTLGAGGIDMSAASQNLLLNALVALAADQSWNVAAGRTLTANGVLSGTNVNLNKIGLGDLILGGANTFTGTTTIGGGTLTLNGSLNGTTGTDLTFAGTGIFNVSAASGVSQGMKVLRFSGGDGTVRSTNNGGTSTVSFTSRAARAAGATGNFVISGGTAGTPGSPGTLGTNNITISGELTAQLLDRGLFYNGSQYAAYDAGGFVRGVIYGTDTNAPATIATAATLGVNDETQNVQISGDITAQTTASVNTISEPGSFTITLAGGQTLSFNGLLKSGGNATTISGGTGITTTASGNEMVIRTDAPADTLTINTSILANGTSSLTKSGDGTMIFSTANSYAGVTSINAGVLQIGAGGTSGSLGSGNVNNSASLVFNRSDSFTVTNLISGSGSLTKSGAATLTLSGPNSYSGVTSILSGVLSISASNNLGNDSVSNNLVINGGTLLDTGVTTSSRGLVVGAGGASIDVAGGATLTLTGNVTTPQTANDLNFTKKGLGVLNFTGGTIYTDVGALPNRIINVTQGTLNFTNATVFLSSLLTQTNNNAYITATNSSLRIDDTVNNWYHGGLRVGYGNGVSSYAMNGGSLWLNDNGNDILIAQNGNTGKGVMTVDGGALVHTGGIELADTDNTFGEFNVRNATVTNTWKLRVGTSKGIGVVNMLGGILDNNSDEINLQYRMGQANCWGIVNLNGGVMKATKITSGDGTAGFTGNRSYINFHGGTLSPSASSLDFVSSTLTGANAGIISAPQLMVYSEGALLDIETGKDITIGVPLQAPSGNGVTETTITLTGVNQGSGYRGEPVVKVELAPGGLANVTSTAVANMVDDGTGNGTFKITAITITNPGVNFTAVPALNIYGGDPTTAATVPALTISPNVSGGLTKAGAGTLALSATNTYTGVTTISGGTLQIGNGGTTGSIATTTNVVNNGVLAFNRTDNYGGDFTRVISGSGSVKVSGGILTFPGTNTYTGSTILSGGTLSVGANANFGDGGALIFDGGTLQVTGTAVNNFDSHAPTFNAGKTVGVDVNNAANTITITQPLNQGTGGLTKLGAGKLILTGGNTYTGLTTISGGTLHIGNGGSGASISSSSGIVMSNDSQLVFNIADNTGFAQSISGAGSLFKAGAGTLTLLGSDTYIGATTVSAGTLAVNGTITGAMTVNGGAVLGGVGTAGSVTVNGGVIAPGDPGAPGGIGDFTINGNVSFSGGSALNIQFDYDIPSKDLLNLTGTGTLTISSGAVLNVSVSVTDLDIARIYINQPLTIIDYSDGGWSSTGPGNNVFAGMNDDQTFIAPSGFTYQISYDGTGGASEVTLTLVSVPEPGSAVTLLGGLGLLLGLRRRVLHPSPTKKDPAAEAS